MSAILLNSTQIAQLFQNHNAAIVAFLLNRVACPETAQDLSQETYLRLLNKGEITHDENIIGYLFRIADRLAIDYLRQGHLPRNNTVALTDDLHCPQLQPDVLTELRERCQLVLDAINSLPLKYQRVFLLRKIDELSYNQIAQQLAISEKTVQRYLVNALLHCHHYLENPPR
ncbi:MAG: sigma-70 family RNA polymerase sigma factor [Methylococcales bacterium]|nr:sigma-70 family RNA polymerase sigma factor [Methylococcales bacterium]MDP3839746.1 sigma-70 family RNA polymerase sigma factor [Methylococcales bacterium]